MSNDMPRNMISELRRRISRDGETVITAAEYNQLQVEWIRRIGAEHLIKEAEERQRSLLKLIHDDLLMRAETDDDGRKVVDISGFIWVKIKQALNEVKSDVDNMQD